MNRQRSIVWGATLLALLAAAGVNAAVLRFSGFELLSLNVMVVVPLGAALLVGIPSGTFYVAAKALRVKAGAADLVFLMAANIGTLVLSLFLEYLLVSSHGTASGMSFSRFVAYNLTEAKHAMYMRGMPADAPPVAPGSVGWLLFLIRIALAMALAKTVQSSLDGKGTKQWAPGGS